MRCESVHTSRHVAGCVLMSSGLALSPTSPDLSALHHLPPDADHAGPLHVAEFADLIIVELFGRGRPFGLGSTRGDGALPEPLRASRPFELFRQFTEPFKDEPPKTLEFGRSCPCLPRRPRHGGSRRRGRHRARALPGSGGGDEVASRRVGDWPRATRDACQWGGGSLSTGQSTLGAPFGHSPCDRRCRRMGKRRGRSSGLQPAMALAHANASALSVMPGNRLRSSTAAANSPPWSKAARIAAASVSVTTNMLDSMVSRTTPGKPHYGSVNLHGQRTDHVPPIRIIPGRRKD